MRLDRGEVERLEAMRGATCHGPVRVGDRWHLLIGTVLVEIDRVALHPEFTTRQRITDLAGAPDTQAPTLRTVASWWRAESGATAVPRTDAPSAAEPQEFVTTFEDAPDTTPSRMERDEYAVNGWGDYDSTQTIDGTPQTHDAPAGEPTPKRRFGFDDDELPPAPFVSSVTGEYRPHDRQIVEGWDD